MPVHEPSALCQADELLAGSPSTLDLRKRQGTHDACINDALKNSVDREKQRLVGVMDGRAVLRRGTIYRAIAELAWHLSRVNIRRRVWKFVERAFAERAMATRRCFLKCAGLVALATCVGLVRPPQARAWGDRGHSIIAEIAERHLSAHAKAEVRAVMGSQASLASVASWADDYKFTTEGQRTKSWHFVDTDLNDSYDPKTCNANGCLVSALTEQSQILGDAARPNDERRRALLMLVHLVGDSTQPFHCGERANDAGANGVYVTFNGVGPDGAQRPIALTKLHAVWDDVLIDDHAWSWGAYADALDQSVFPKLDPISIDGSFAETWINDCHKVERPLFSDAAIPRRGGRRRSVLSKESPAGPGSATRPRRAAAKNPARSATRPQVSVEHLSSPQYNDHRIATRQCDRFSEEAETRRGSAPLAPSFTSSRSFRWASI